MPNQVKLDIVEKSTGRLKYKITQGRDNKEKY